jgi:hypothetical protein
MATLTWVLALFLQAGLQAGQSDWAGTTGPAWDIDKSSVSLAERTGMNRSDVITWFDNTEDQANYDSDVIYQRMDLVSEFQIPEWQARVRQWHSEGRIVHGVLHPLTHIGRIFEYVMNDPGLQAAVCLDFNLNPIVTG